MTPSDNDIMTIAQRETVQKAYTMLGEQFDQVLIVINFDVNTGEDGSIEEAHEGYWKGGCLAAVGMAEFAKIRIMESRRDSSNRP